jgi:ornithine carbamoyltransferase
MAFNLKNRSFLKEIDFEPRELRFLLRLAEALKLARYAGTEAQRLVGKEIALIFEKTSTRTRSAFEVGAFDQGAHVTYLDPSGSQLGHKESIADTASAARRNCTAQGRRRPRGRHRRPDRPSQPMVIASRRSFRNCADTTG